VQQDIKIESIAIDIRGNVRNTHKIILKNSGIRTSALLLEVCEDLEQ
jgi:hypothetical protein